jgi:hypothetical protein
VGRVARQRADLGDLAVERAEIHEPPVGQAAALQQEVEGGDHLWPGHAGLERSAPEADAAEGIGAGGRAHGDEPPRRAPGQIVGVGGQEGEHGLSEAPVEGLEEKVPRQVSSPPPGGVGEPAALSRVT